MSTEDSEILNAMERHGGVFVKNLAKLARAADPENLAIIKAAWPEYWRGYAEIARRLAGADFTNTEGGAGAE